MITVFIYKMNAQLKTASVARCLHANLYPFTSLDRCPFGMDTVDQFWMTVKTNRDSGEQEIQFVNEHKAPDGKPLQIPNLIIIAIPVFMGGAPYRMPVRFRYRKLGGEVRFILSIYNPEKAFEAAFKEAVEAATTETDLPTFMGSPES